MLDLLLLWTASLWSPAIVLGVFAALHRLPDDRP